MLQRGKCVRIHKDVDGVAPAVEGINVGDSFAAHRPDAFERSMIEFASSWHRFGGGSPAQIFVDFGMPEAVFFSRTLLLLATDYSASHFDPEVLRGIRKVCRARLLSLSSMRARS
ncbi:hypothetical protein BA059_27175 [Mycolicibacterium sp. (ex Dasyatis americana)]|nr:hypothetical protein BA059_27175 [Mycolicibacterium sp. (ex Dasyatis americana)]